MPRQPYLNYDSEGSGALLDFSISSLGSRPEFEALIGRCVMAWPTVEVEMAMILGHLLGAKDAATLAVFQQLRRSSAQRDAIMEAANIVLNETDIELISASLNAHKVIEGERNAFAHGHFGISSNLTDAILWMGSTDYIKTKSVFSLIPEQKPPLSQILKSIYVYKLRDLQTVLDDIDWLTTHWFQVLEYLRTPITVFETRAQRYRQLCDQPHIARELATLRQKNNPPKPPQPPKP